MDTVRAGMRRAIHTSPKALAAIPLRSNTSIVASRTGYSSLSASPRRNSTLRLQRSVCPSISSRYLHSSKRQLSQAPTVETPTLQYAISAAYSAKHNRFSQGNVYNHDPYVRQKPGRREKKTRPKSGEDSFFISPVNSTGNVAFGVVDGVGGWTTSGVDPADFAHGLCEYMTGAATTWPEWEDIPDNSGIKVAGATDYETLDPLRPVELLQEGYDKVLNDKTIFAGGSTACLAIAAPNGRVEVANLGDSGLLHLSPHRITALTNPQTHAFNTPFQLSKLPPRLLVQQAIFGGGKPYSELPANSDVSAHMLAPGDILVLATDGVWDNLSAQDILGLVSHEMDAADAWGVKDDGAYGVSTDLARLTEKGGEESLQAKIALAVTKTAKEASLSRTRDGPFAKEVQRLYPQENWKGGKADDICVVVALAVAADKT